MSFGKVTFVEVFLWVHSGWLWLSLRTGQYLPACTSKLKAGSLGRIEGGHLIWVIGLNWCDKEERDKGREEEKEGKGNLFKRCQTCHIDGEVKRVWERISQAYLKKSVLRLSYLLMSISIVLLQTRSCQTAVSVPASFTLPITQSLKLIFSLKVSDAHPV